MGTGGNNPKRLAMVKVMEVAEMMDHAFQALDFSLPKQYFITIPKLQHVGNGVFHMKVKGILYKVAITSMEFENK